MWVLKSLQRREQLLDLFNERLLRTSWPYYPLCSLATAFKRGTLSQTIDLGYAIDSFDCEMSCGHELQSQCSLCKRVLDSFPLNQLLQLFEWFGNTCVNAQTIEKKIRGTHWTKRCLELSSACFSSEVLVQLDHLEVGEEHKIALEKGGAVDPQCVYFLASYQRRRLRLMVNMGINLKMREAIGHCDRLTKKSF